MNAVFLQKHHREQYDEARQATNYTNKNVLKQIEKTKTDTN